MDLFKVLLCSFLATFIPAIFQILSSAIMYVVTIPVKLVLRDSLRIRNFTVQIVLTLIAVVQALPEAYGYLLGIATSTLLVKLLLDSTWMKIASILFIILVFFRVWLLSSNQKKKHRDVNLPKSVQTTEILIQSTFLYIILFSVPLFWFELLEPEKYFGWLFNLLGEHL